MQNLPCCARLLAEELAPSAARPGASSWINATVLAVLVGRPALGAVGLVTAAPVLVLYARSRRR